MNGVSLAGGFVVLEDASEEERNVHAQWMRRSFLHIRDGEPSREERLADLAEPLAEGDDAAHLDRLLAARFPGLR